MVVLVTKICFCLILLISVCFAAEDKKETPARTIAITAERFIFTPSRIKLKQGELVEFVLTSEDTGHGFSIAGTSINAVIPPSGMGELRIRFVPNRTGQFVLDPANGFDRFKSIPTVFFNSS